VIRAERRRGVALQRPEAGVVGGIDDRRAVVAPASEAVPVLAVFHDSRLAHVACRIDVPVSGGWINRAVERREADQYSAEAVHGDRWIAVGGRGIADHQALRSVADDLPENDEAARAVVRRMHDPEHAVAEKGVMQQRAVALDALRRSQLRAVAFAEVE